MAQTPPVEVTARIEIGGLHAARTGGAQHGAEAALASAQSKDEVDGRVVRNAVLCQRARVLQQLARADEADVIGGKAGLRGDGIFHASDAVRRMHVEREAAIVAQEYLHPREPRREGWDAREGWPSSRAALAARRTRDTRAPPDERRALYCDICMYLCVSAARQ